MTDKIDCQLDCEDLLALIDHYDKCITKLEKKLAEMRYSYKYDNSKGWLTATEPTRRAIIEFRQKAEYFVDMYNIISNFDNSQYPQE